MTASRCRAARFRPICLGSFSLLLGLLPLLTVGEACAVEPAGGNPVPEQVESAQVRANDNAPAAPASEAQPAAVQVAAPQEAAAQTPRAETPDASVDSPRTWLARTPEVVETKPESTTSPLSYGAALFVLFGLGGAALYAKKRRGRGRGLLALDPQRIRVISSTKIGPRAHVVATEVSGKVMLLGVTEHSVNHLGWLNSPKFDAEYPLLAGDDDEPVVDPAVPERGSPESSRLEGNATSSRATSRGPSRAPQGMSTAEFLKLGGQSQGTERPAGVPRSFREVLGGVLGDVRRGNAVADLDDLDVQDNAAAALLAEQTAGVDEFVEAPPQPQRVARDTGRRRRVLDEGPLSEAAYRSSLEEQVAGLVRRRQETRK